MIPICYIIDNIQSPTAGTEKQLLRLLENVDTKNFEPYLCVLQMSDWVENEFDLCPVFCADIYSYKKISAWINVLKLARFFRRKKIRVVQTHFTDANWAGVVAGRLAGVDLILSSRRNQGYWYTPVDRFLQRCANLFADRFVANCITTKEWLAKTEGVSAERIDVIYNGVQFGPDAPRNGVGVVVDPLVDWDGPLVVMVANLRPVKRVDLFLRAARLVLDQMPNVRFVIIGDGELRGELEDLARSLGIDGKVFFLGRRTDVQSLLARSDLGVLSSDSESFSNSVLEYMASSLPVVATDVGGIREAIEEGCGGWLVPPGEYTLLAEKVVEVLADKKLGAMGAYNKGRVEKQFTVEKMVRDYEALYLDNLAA